MTTAGYIFIGVMTLSTVISLTLWYSAVRKGKEDKNEKQKRR